MVCLSYEMFLFDMSDLWHHLSIRYSFLSYRLKKHRETDTDRDRSLVKPDGFCFCRRRTDKLEVQMDSVIIKCNIFPESSLPNFFSSFHFSLCHLPFFWLWFHAWDQKTPGKIMKFIWLWSLYERISEIYRKNSSVVLSSWSFMK